MAQQYKDQLKENNKAVIIIIIIIIIIINEKGDDLVQYGSLSY